MEKLLPRPFWIAPVVALVAALLTYFFLGFISADIWEGLELTISGKTGEYCEFVNLPQLIRQPANSWSNFFYLMFGIWVFQSAWKGRKNQNRYFPLEVFVALTFAYLCFGSFLFHASMTLLGQRWDMAATYALTSSIGFWVALQIWEIRSGIDPLRRSLILGIAILVAICFYLFKWQLNAFIALPVEILMVAGLSIWLSKLKPAQFPGKYLIAPLLAILAALILRQLDVAKVGCDPQTWLQGHAAWHLLTGFSGFLIWRFTTIRRVPSAPNLSPAGSSDA